MDPYYSIKSHLSFIQQSLGYCFSNPHLLLQAFVHRSYLNEQKKLEQSNERLEFLGDVVFGLVVSDHLYHLFPNLPEGELSARRACLVEARACTQYIEDWGLGRFLLVGKGEKIQGSIRGRPTILADLFEALIGAIYLDGGLKAVESVIKQKLNSHFQQLLASPVQNWKSLLQDYCQRHHQAQPVYSLIEETGPGHARCFKIAVSVNQSILGIGSGPSKKEAAQAAAASAWQQLSAQ